MTSQHPGKVLLQQYLQPQKISQNRLARAIKVPPRRINEIIPEKRSLTADTAVRLAIYFGGSASYWMHLQAKYEIEKIKNNISIQLSTIQASPQTPIPLESSKKNTRPAGKIKRRIMR
ncbi:MAG: HigA family addiction module antidote protein [Gammaproteobacteria bacterium]|nr:HigA family addiction module antidote protein [Gammaproteobacteria bacterium]